MKYFTLSIIVVNVFISQFLYSQHEKKEITLEDIFVSRKFQPERIHRMQSMKDGENYCKISSDSLNVYSYKTGKHIKTIVDATRLIPSGDSTPISIRDYTLSNDENLILFATETESIYRHSRKSTYYVYDIKANKLKLLSEGGQQQFATFSPDSKHIAFVRNNNLFYTDLNENREIQVTTDGLRNSIINGSTDWVYEEEFGFSKAFFWSPDGSKIAYYRFDESRVKEFQITNWGDLYPEQYQYKYPKAGEANSVVDILVYDLETQGTIPMNIEDDVDIYIPRIKWTNDPNRLSILWLNRLQNEVRVLLTNANSGISESVYQETNKYYININDYLTFLNNGEQFILSSEKDGFNHLYLYNLNGELENQITKGAWDVSEFLGVNEKKGLVYYLSSESSPLNRELYSINLEGHNKRKISSNEGTNTVKFSTGFKYFINYYSNANQPALITVNSANGKIIRTLSDNAKLKNTLTDYSFGQKEFFSFKTSENIELNGWMIKPIDFDPSLTYPVLLYTYGGPGSQTVRNRWGRRDSWYHMLASKGIIVVSVDNRGTGSRGEEFKKMTYLQLGKYETMDQIETAKYLRKLKYIDPERIGIWGWSYGGYLSSLCITKGAEYFNMAIAVAPVTNWRYYDNIYTERFMRTPLENPQGYEDNSPINHVDKLEGKYLIIHGTGDDNVHVQNTMDMVTALVNENKQFDLQLYPNSNHGIYTGRNTTLHLYSLMTEFILENLLNTDSN